MNTSRLLINVYPTTCERESEQPDPIALISQEVEGERQRFNATIDNLKADIDQR